MRGPFDVQRELHDRLRGARSRALRAAGVVGDAGAKRILEIGCGFAFALPEWLHRTRGDVTLLDRDPPDEAFRAAADHRERVRLVAADAGRLPFGDASFDLVFAQCTLLWLDETARRRAIDEAARVLVTGGAFVAIEPDHRSLVVDPDPHGLFEFATTSLSRAGADVATGRSLPRLCEGADLETTTLLFDRVEPASTSAVDLLADLTRDAEETSRLETISRWIAASSPTIHLPFWIVVGLKAGRAASVPPASVLTARET